MQAVLRLSALHHRLLAAGARMRPARGWEQAESFGDRDAEVRDLRTGVVLADLSAQHLTLVQAHDLAGWLPSAPGLGEVALVANGGSPVRCCRLTDDSALFAGAVPAALPPAPGACGHVTDLTSGRTIVAVAGPRSLDLLRAATQVDLRERAMPDRRCLQTSVARVPAIVLRFDRLGVPAYEILVPRDFGEYLWDALLDAGAPVGVRPVGAAALDRGGLTVRQLFSRARMWRRRELAPRYDVVIIGGGAHGLATAYYLAKHGAGSIAVLEMSYIGSGGSGRNTAIVRGNYRTPEGVPFYARSVQMYERLGEELDYNLLFSQQGHLTLAHTDAAVTGLRIRAEVNRLMGVDSRLIWPEEIGRLVPGLDLSTHPRYPILAALYHPPGGIIRHDAVVWGYARGADRLGVHIHPFTQVTAIRREGRGVSGVMTTRGEIRTGVVVNCTAGYCSTVARMVDVDLPITTHPLHALVTEPLKPFLHKIIVSATLHVYVSQTDRGELVIGAEVDPYASYSTRSTLPFLESAAQHTLELFPSLARVRVLRQWAGVCDMTPDFSPIIGPVPERPGFFLDVGWGTWGFKAAPVAGLMTAQCVATGEVPSLVRPFALDRFYEDRLVGEKAAAAVSH